MLHTIQDPPTGRIYRCAKCNRPERVVETLLHGASPHVSVSRAGPHHCRICADNLEVEIAQAAADIKAHEDAKLEASKAKQAKVRGRKMPKELAVVHDTRSTVWKASLDTGRVLGSEPGPPLIYLGQSKCGRARLTSTGPDGYESKIPLDIFHEHYTWEGKQA